MSDLSRMIRVVMQGLVDRAGGVEAAAMLIGARLGTDVSKGSISKRNKGDLSWPLDEIIALEDAVGDKRVRHWLKNSDPEEVERQCVMQAAATLIRESGEAAFAVMEAAAGRGCEAHVRKEVQDVLAASKTLASLMEARHAG